MTKTPHGLGTGALLPYVLQACLPAIGSRLVALGIAMGVVEAGQGESDAAASASSTPSPSSAPASDCRSR